VLKPSPRPENQYSLGQVSLSGHKFSIPICSKGAVVHSAVDRLIDAIPSWAAQPLEPKLVSDSYEQAAFAMLCWFLFDDEFDEVHQLVG